MVKLQRTRGFILSAFATLLLAGAAGAADDFPVDSIKGPVCVLKDTIRNVSFALSPAQSQYNVIVTDGLAHISLTQKFVNSYADINSIVYVFPLPHNGSVHAMRMEYRDSIYEARIYEKEQAQQIYDSVVTSGGNAALLIQTRPNVFQQHLANIAKGDSAYVQIEVSMPLKYDSGVYELAIPTMIGGRFQSAGADPVPSGPFWNPPPDRSGQRLQINVLIQTGFPVVNVSSPTHPLNLQMIEIGRPLLEQRSLLTADTELPMPYNRVALLHSAVTYPNSDFVLRFSRQLAVHDFSLATSFDPDRSAGHFALNIYPDTSLMSGARPDLEIVLLIDISGSQGGWPIVKEREIANEILDRLLTTDRLTVLAFNTSVFWAFSDPEPVPANAANISTARSFVNGLGAGGGTYLLQGIQAALSAPTTTEHERYYIFLTDGFITNEEAIFDELRNHPTNPTVFTFGAGNNLNRYFLEQTAAIGNGFATEITQLEPVGPKVDQAWQKIESPQLKDVSVDFGGANVFDLIMPLGSNLYVGSPLVVYGMYRNGGLHTVTVQGYREGQPVDFSQDINFAIGRNLNRMVDKVWARHKIEQLVVAEGNTTANKDSIIAVSIDYQVLSKYTAFLAINPQDAGDGNISSPFDSSFTTAVNVPLDMSRSRFSMIANGHALMLQLPDGMLLEELVVFDLHGRVVYRLTLNRADMCGRLTWDGRLHDGRRLQPGRYIVRIRTNRGTISRTITWRR